MQNLTIEPFHVIGIAKRTSNVNGQAAKEIAELWQQFMSENILEKIPNKVDPSIYSLYTEYEGDYLKPYTAMLCCKVENLNNIPDGMLGKSIVGGSYVKLSTKGDLAKGIIVDQWTRIWEMDLDRAYTADFELFGEKAQDPSNAEVDFFIAVK